MNTKVLVVDDDTVFCQLVKRGLERHEYQVHISQNETDALDATKTFQPEFILLDLRLGDSSGVHLIKPILEICPHCKILILTGYASLATAVQAIKLGAINYLAKPVDIPTILKALSDPEQIPDENHQDNIEEMSPTSLKRLEWEHIQRVLHENDGNISATARQLNMHRRTLQRKLQKKPTN